MIGTGLSATPIASGRDCPIASPIQLPFGALLTRHGEVQHLGRVDEVVLAVGAGP